MSTGPGAACPLGPAEEPPQVPGAVCLRGLAAVCLLGPEVGCRPVLAEDYRQVREGVYPRVLAEDYRQVREGVYLQARAEGFPRVRIRGAGTTSWLVPFGRPFGAPSSKG